MILPDHNAHLVKVESPSVPADVPKAVAGSLPATKWEGDCQAHLSTQREEGMHGGARVIVTQTVATLPANLINRVSFEVEDILTFEVYGQTQKLHLREVDQRYRPIGKIMLTLRRA